MSTLERVPNRYENTEKNKISEKEILKPKRTFDLPKEDSKKSPEWFKVHKHIENLLRSLQKPKEVDQEPKKAEQEPKEAEVGNDETVKGEGKELQNSESHYEDKEFVNSLDELHKTSEKHHKEKTNTIVTNVIDFVPVVGSAKMVMEGLRGRQYGTDNEIHGAQRVIHTASGAVFFLLDITGVGSLLSEVGKGALKVGERVVVKKMEQEALKATERIVASDAEKADSSKIIEEETKKLAARGERRQEMGDEIKSH